MHRLWQLWMSATRRAAATAVEARAEPKCRRRLPSRRAASSALALTFVLATIFALPNAATAHGPVAPVATSYLGRVTHAPIGVDAKVVNGYLWLWLRVPANLSLVVLDYRGAPYVEFSRAGVFLNENSEMYYLNSSPVQTPPRYITPNTPPMWRHFSDEHEYAWHDGRIGALASTVIPPGTSYVGRWSIAAFVKGRLTAITGTLWHAPGPSLVWFWPIVVLIACVLAAWRLHKVELDVRLSRVLAIAVLAAIGVGAVARQLYGRPGVPAVQVVLAAILVAFAVWGIARALLGRAGFIQHLITAGIAFWIGLELLPTLLHGYVLTAGPPVMARTAAVLCLGGCVVLVPLSIRAALDEPERVAVS